MLTRIQKRHEREEIFLSGNFSNTLRARRKEADLQDLWSIELTNNQPQKKFENHMFLYLPAPLYIAQINSHRRKFPCLVAWAERRENPSRISKKILRHQCISKSKYFSILNLEAKFWWNSRWKQQNIDTPRK